MVHCKVVTSRAELGGIIWFLGIQIHHHHHHHDVLSLVERFAPMDHRLTPSLSFIVRSSKLVSVSPTTLSSRVFVVPLPSVFLSSMDGVVSSRLLSRSHYPQCGAHDAFSSP